MDSNELIKLNQTKQMPLEQVLSAPQDVNDEENDDNESCRSDVSDCESSSDSATLVRQKTRWGWIVVFASMIIHMIADGICFSYGVLLYKLKDDFDVSKDKVALVGSLLGGIPLFMGPLCSFLINRFSCRSVTVVGGLLTAIGFFISSFVTKFNWFYLTISLMSGLGLSLVYVPAVVIVAYYFDEKRSLATGLAVSGTGTGYALFAPLIDIMLEKYNWHGTMRILAACFLLISFCGLLFKPIVYKIEKKDAETKKLATRELRKRILNDSRLPSQMNSVEKLEKFIENMTMSVEDESKSTVSSTIGNKTENDGLLNGVQRVSSTNIHGRNRHKSVNTNENDDDSDYESYRPPFNLIKSFSIAVLPSFYLGIDSSFEQKPKKPQIATLSIKEMYLKTNKQAERQSLEVKKNSQIWDLIDRTVVLNNLKKEHTEEEHPIRQVEPKQIEIIRQDTTQRSYYLTSVLGNLAGFLGKLKHKQELKNRLATFQMPLSRKDIFYRGSLMNIRRTLLKTKATPTEWNQTSKNENPSLALSCPNLHTRSRYSLTTTSSTSQSSLSSQEDDLVDAKCQVGAKRVCKIIKHMLPFNILKNPSFLLFGFANFIFYMWHETPMMFIRDYTEECKCMEKHRIWILLISCGLANTVGQWIYGYFGDKENVNEKILYSVSTILCGFTVLTIPLVLYNYTLLLLNQILFGVFISANYVLNSIILVEILGVNKLTDAYGLLLLLQGFALVIGSPIAGWIGDTTGNYNNTFYYSGFFIIVSGIILLFLPLTERIVKRKRELKKKSLKLNFI